VAEALNGLAHRWGVDDRQGRLDVIGEEAMKQGEIALAQELCQQRSTCRSMVSSCQGSRDSIPRARRSWRVKAVPLLSRGSSSS
jgi:hypothetical protein